MKKLLLTAACLVLALLCCAAAAEEAAVITYEELLECDGTQTVFIEAVIGEIRVYGQRGKTAADFDLWIKAGNGYGYERKTVSDVTSWPHTLATGLRVVYELTPKKGGSFTSKQILSRRVVGEDADWAAIEAEYKRARFAVMPYGELTERIDALKGTGLCVEGVYTTEISCKEGVHFGLLTDGDGNRYLLTVDERALRVAGPAPGDRVRVYGTIPMVEPLYEDVSESGTRMIPRIKAVFLEWVEGE